MDLKSSLWTWMYEMLRPPRPCLHGYGRSPYLDTVGFELYIGRGAIEDQISRVKPIFSIF